MQDGQIGQNLAFKNGSYTDTSARRRVMHWQGLETGSWGKSTFIKIWETRTMCCFEQRKRPRKPCAISSGTFRWGDAWAHWTVGLVVYVCVACLHQGLLASNSHDNRCCIHHAKIRGGFVSPNCATRVRFKKLLNSTLWSHFLTMRDFSDHSFAVFQFGYTSAPGEGGIMQFKDYDRKFSPHVVR